MFPPLTIQVAGTKLRIGGHSLGGALATLSFLELSLQGEAAQAATLCSPGCNPM